LGPAEEAPVPDWSHAPVHRLDEQGTYFVTAGTYLKRRLLDTPAKLQLVHDALLGLGTRHGWALQAWAVLANHYHFVGVSPENAASLRDMLSELHERTAAQLNAADGTPGRKVWFQYWDKQLTYQRSYIARLRYVHENPVHHGVVRHAAEYPWCSAAWFERTASPGFRRVVSSFRIDKLKVYDEF
jgi:putative transposase